MPHDHGNHDRHGHGHGHHHHAPKDDRQLAWAVAVNLGLTLAQIAGGIVSGSLALIADALHNFSDAASLVIAWAARRIARRPADAAMTFGYARAEVIAALINYTILVVVGLYLGVEALMRFADPQPVDGLLMIAVAGLALLVDLATALLTWRMSRNSLNMRAAFEHNVADAMGSVAVIVAGIAVMIGGWTLVDPIVTLGISAYVLWMAMDGGSEAIRILMMGTPPRLDPEEVSAQIMAVPGVDGLHHLHLWQLGENDAALDAHLVITEDQWNGADAIKDRVRTALARHLQIRHATLEIEQAGQGCIDPPRFCDK
ncbi:MAG: cation diffusion facilitator family transporter [Limimaricola sp.]|uniref:cation diffusion facilitator family transporter n=1 Tax=Limimaricola sp. TaxID=2211665 RepID=UPI001E08CF13|nr:cation diffusion facilitator family transporter [Limimaricola sp.]MBI1417107.1 cation diffusion facilitator family transporter [Limimaricola sp.]